MTEKRFEYYNHKGADYILDTPNKSLDFIEMLGDCLEAEEIVDLLNGLNDENEQLQTKNNAYLQDIEVYKEDNTHLKLENEQLKSIIGKLTLDNTKMKKVLNTTKKENEKLKQILNELSDMLQFDVENGIRSYPVKLSEYLSNALKELQIND